MIMVIKAILMLLPEPIPTVVKTYSSITASLSLLSTLFTFFFGLIIFIIARKIIFKIIASIGKRVYKKNITELEYESFNHKLNKLLKKIKVIERIGIWGSILLIIGSSVYLGFTIHQAIQLI